MRKLKIKGLNVILYLIILISVAIIAMPIIILQCNYLKCTVLRFFLNKEIALSYLQYIGGFFGVIVTILVTIVLQKKNDNEELIKSKLNLYVQLEEAFKKYIEAQDANKEYPDKINLKSATGPREIFIDPNYMKDLASLKLILDKELYNEIGLAFDLVVNSNKYYLDLERKREYIKSEKEIDDKNYKSTYDDAVDIIVENNLKKHKEHEKYMNRINSRNKKEEKINKEILSHVDVVCKVYNEKYKKVLDELSKV